VESGYATPCWKFQLAKNAKGYGFCRDGKTKVSLAHRV